MRSQASVIDGINQALEIISHQPQHTASLSSIFSKRNDNPAIARELMQHLQLSHLMTPHELMLAIASIESMMVKAPKGKTQSFREFLEQQGHAVLANRPKSGVALPSKKIVEVIISKEEKEKEKEKPSIASNEHLTELLIDMHQQLLNMYQHIEKRLHAPNPHHISTLDGLDLAASTVAQKLKDYSSEETMGRQPILLRDTIGQLVTVNQTFLPIEDQKILENNLEMVKAIENLCEDQVSTPGSKASRICYFGGQNLEADLTNLFFETMAVISADKNSMTSGLVFPSCISHINWKQDLEDETIVANIQIQVLTLLDNEDKIYAISTDGSSLITTNDSDLRQRIFHNAELAKLSKNQGETAIVPICTIVAEVEVVETKEKQALAQAEQHPAYCLQFKIVNVLSNTKALDSKKKIQYKVEKAKHQKTQNATKPLSQKTIIDEINNTLQAASNETSSYFLSGLFHSSNHSVIAKKLHHHLQLSNMMTPHELAEAIAALESMQVKIAGEKQPMSMSAYLERQKFQTLSVEQSRLPDEPSNLLEKPVIKEILTINEPSSKGEKSTGKMENASENMILGPTQNFAELLVEIHQQLLACYKQAYLRAHGFSCIDRLILDGEEEIRHFEGTAKLEAYTKLDTPPAGGKATEDFIRGGSTIENKRIISTDPDDLGFNPDVIAAIEEFTGDKVKTTGSQANKIFYFGGQTLQGFLAESFSSMIALPVFSQTTEGLIQCTNQLQAGFNVGTINWKKNIEGKIIAEVEVHNMIMIDNSQIGDAQLAIAADGDSLMSIKPAANPETFEKLNAAFKAAKTHHNKQQAAMVPTCSMRATIELTTDAALEHQAEKEKQKDIAGSSNIQPSYYFTFREISFTLNTPCLQFTRNISKELQEKTEKEAPFSRFTTQG